MYIAHWHVPLAIASRNTRGTPPTLASLGSLPPKPSLQIAGQWRLAYEPRFLLDIPRTRLKRERELQAAHEPHKTNKNKNPPLDSCPTSREPAVFRPGSPSVRHPPPLFCSGTSQYAIWSDANRKIKANIKINIKTHPRPFSFYAATPQHLSSESSGLVEAQLRTAQYAHSGPEMSRWNLVW